MTDISICCHERFKSKVNGISRYIGVTDANEALKNTIEVPLKMEV